jgi:hypothetical protein
MDAVDEDDDEADCIHAADDEDWRLRLDKLPLLCDLL